MNKIICIFIAVAMFTGIFNITSYATEYVDYSELYMDFAKDADENSNSKLSGMINGLILMDLNRDEVPELLAVITTPLHFDENGNQIYALDEGYDNPAYIEYSHNISKAFSIIDGKIVEDTPWNYGKYSEVISMPYPPEEEVTDTEDFCTTVQYRGREDYLVMCEMSEHRPDFVAIWYDDGGFHFSRDGFDEHFFDVYSEVDIPSAYVKLYIEKGKHKPTYTEAMNFALNKYKAKLGASKDESIIKNNVSDWALAEVNEAKKLNLVPQEMLNDNFAENISRGEFVAIAMQLHQAVSGEKLNCDDVNIADIDGNVYETYIKGAYKLGITNGTSKDYGEFVFSSGTDISRQQLATMLSRVIKVNKSENWTLENDDNFEFDTTNVAKFSDDYMISDYANNSVYYMIKHGLIKGMGDRRFAPFDIATKEQAIVLALRTYKAFNNLPPAQKKGDNKKLKVNYDVVKKGENTTAGELISGLEDNKYTIEQLSEILNIDFQKTGEIIDHLGLISCNSFEWNRYYVTLVTYNEEAESYKELDKYPTYIECDDLVMIRTTEVKDFKLNFNELSLHCGEVYKTLFARVYASRLSEVDVEWISSDEDVAVVEDKGEIAYVYAKNPGTTYITAKVREGDMVFQAQCEVTVEN